MPGDMLFHVAGSRHPVLLRPCPPAAGASGQPNMYNLVGLCSASDLSDDIVEEALLHPGEVRIR
jgi:hypothetical protein